MPTKTPAHRDSPESIDRSHLRQSARWRWWWYVSPQLWLRKIVTLNDTPHSIALGTSIGVFVAMTPTVGIQMVLVLALAALFKPLFQFNRVAGLIAVYISNPVTTVPIYWFNYWVGTFFVAGTVTRQDLKEALEYNGWADWWQSLVQLTWEFGWPLIIGSLVVGLACAVPSYPIMKWLVHVLKRKHRLIHIRRRRRLGMRGFKSFSADEYHL